MLSDFRYLNRFKSYPGLNNMGEGVNFQIEYLLNQLRYLKSESINRRSSMRWINVQNFREIESEINSFITKELCWGWKSRNFGNFSFFLCKIFISDPISLKFCTFIHHMELRRLMLSDFRYLNRFKSYSIWNDNSSPNFQPPKLLLQTLITFEPIEIFQIWKHQSTQLYVMNKCAKFQWNRITNKNFTEERSNLNVRDCTLNTMHVFRRRRPLFSAFVSAFTLAFAPVRW